MQISYTSQTSKKQSTDKTEKIKKKSGCGYMNKTANTAVNMPQKTF